MGKSGALVSWHPAYSTELDKGIPTLLRIPTSVLNPGSPPPTHLCPLPQGSLCLRASYTQHNLTVTLGRAEFRKEMTMTEFLYWGSGPWRCHREGAVVGDVMAAGINVKEGDVLTYLDQHGGLSKERVLFCG